MGLTSDIPPTIDNAGEDTNMVSSSVPLLVKTCESGPVTTLQLRSRALGFGRLYLCYTLVRFGFVTRRLGPPSPLALRWPVCF